LNLQDRVTDISLGLVYKIGGRQYYPQITGMSPMAGCRKQLQLNRLAVDVMF